MPTDTEMFGPPLTKPRPLTTDNIAAKRAEFEAELAKLDADEAVLIEESGDVVEAPGTDVALPDPWPHQFLEDFYGDKLEIRKPTEQALAGFSLAAGKYMPVAMQNNLVGLFIKQHLSATSLEHVYFRLLDPDDTGYTPKTIGELMRRIAIYGRKEKPEDGPPASTV